MNSRYARLLLVICVVGFLSFYFQANSAYAVTYVITVEATTPRAGINDFAMAFSNAAAFDVTDIESSHFRKATETRDAAKKMAGIAWFDPPAALAKGTKVTSTVKTDSKEFKYKLTRAIWTIDGMPSDEIKEKDLTWKITQEASIDGGIDATFGLDNDSDDYLTFTDLEFLSNSAELPGLAPIGATPGFMLFESLLTLAPHSSSSDYLFGPLDLDTFLYIEGNVFLSDSFGDPLSEGFQFRIGAQAIIPEPGVIVMITCAGGLLILRLLTDRRARSVRQPV